MSWTMVRIPCTGRISKALLFKPFEMGADGVALVGCESGACRYGTGTATAEKNVEDARGIVDLLGLGMLLLGERLRRRLDKRSARQLFLASVIQLPLILLLMLLDAAP